MPNWCENRLAVSGPTEALEAFFTAAKAPWGDGRIAPFSLNALVPMPKELDDEPFPVGATPEEMQARQERQEARQAENQAAFGHKDWYSWRRANWGTKWDVGSPDDVFDVRPSRKVGNKVATLSFDSAWAPPVEAIKTAAAAHPNLRFKLTYEEPGVGFQGELVVKGEEVIEEWTGQMHAHAGDEDGDDS